MSAAEQLLDSTRIRNRRRELGLSARALESRLGVGGNWWHSLEKGVNHPHVTVRELIAIAAELGVDPGELLADRPTGPAVPVDHPEALSQDAARLGRVLADLSRQTTVTRLATALGWTADRVESALDVLATRLPGVGQRLVRGVAGVEIVRDGADIDPVAPELASARINDTGLTPVQASILARVMRGEIHERAASSATMSNSHRVALAELVNAGLVVTAGPQRASTYTPSDRVLRSVTFTQI